MATLCDPTLEMVLLFVFGKGACPTHKRVPFGHLKCSTHGSHAIFDSDPINDPRYHHTTSY